MLGICWGKESGEKGVEINFVFSEGFDGNG